MIKINPNRMLTATAVYFKDDKKPIYNCILFVLDRFLIVGMDPDDDAPTWYNIDTIDRITGVNHWTAPEPKKTQTKTEHWNSLW